MILFLDFSPVHPALQPFCIIQTIEYDLLHSSQPYWSYDEYYDDDLSYGHSFCSSTSFSSSSSSHIHCHYVSEPSTFHTTTNTAYPPPTYHHSNLWQTIKQTHSTTAATTTTTSFTQPQPISHQQQTSFEMQARTLTFPNTHFTSSALTTSP